MACILLALGCSSSSPTSPAQMLVLEGDLFAGGFQSYPVMPGGDGVLRIEVTELTPVLTVGVGLGRPLDDDCAVSASFSLGVGGKLSFSLEDVEYCVQIFDNGSLPPDATIRYVVMADVS